MKVSAGSTPQRVLAEGLRERVRRETSGLHRGVEEATDLPGSIVTWGDYVHLIRRLHGFHLAVEEQLTDPSLEQGWLEVGIDLPVHRRSHLLARDLSDLGADPGPDPEMDCGSDDEETAMRLPGLTGLGEALGCLYVVEGSALGGRVLAPAFRAVLGDVPTGFFDSDGRSHPHPWRSLLAALGAFEAAGGRAGEVVSGAQGTFRVFGNHLAPVSSIGAGNQ